MSIILIFSGVFNQVRYIYQHPARIIIVLYLLPGCGRVDTAIWMHYLDADYTVGEEARRQLYKNAASNIEQVLAATHPQGANCMVTYQLSRKLYKLDAPDMSDTAGEARTRS